MATTGVDVKVVDGDVDVGLGAILALNPLRLGPIPIDGRHQLDVGRSLRHFVAAALPETLEMWLRIPEGYKSTKNDHSNFSTTTTVTAKNASTSQKGVCSLQLYIVTTVTLLPVRQALVNQRQPQ